MLLRDGILYSTLLEDLPVVHGFTTRLCGNLGFGKNPGNHEVVESRKKLFERLDLSSRTLIQPKQTHSNIVLNAKEFQPGTEGDAAYTVNSGHLLSVLTADCVPILVFHPGGVVAVIHAGWRGLESEIILRTMSLLPAGCVAAIGPAIGSCCYEVSEELAVQFEAKFGAEVVSRAGTKPHLDLIGAAVQQLQQSKIEEMDISHICTKCHPDLFFSYRRDGSSGRQMSFLGLSSQLKP